jgi:chromosome segregation ATPase
MSLTSNHPEIPDHHTTETTEPHETAPKAIDAATGARSHRGGTDGNQLVFGTRTRLVSLKAEVELLEAERETLANQVLALEADIADLEEEVSALERAVEHEEQQRQRVIDTYERIIAEKEEMNRELREEAEATSGENTSRRWPLTAVASSVATVWTRLKHLAPTR